MGEEHDVAPVAAQWIYMWGCASSILVAMIAANVDPMKPCPLLDMESSHHKNDMATVVASRVSQSVATLIFFGMHCDTQSFSLPSTTPQDLLAASLIVKLAGPVQELLNHTPVVDADVLQQLRNSMQVHQFAPNGDKVAVAVASRSSSPCASFATCVQRLFDSLASEEIHALFALGTFASPHVVLVGRARADASTIDCMRVCKAFGGGGHKGAAAATIKDETLQSARERLFAHLALSAQAVPVAQLMTSPAVCVGTKTQIATAAQLLLHRSIRSAIVCREDDALVCGVVDRTIADRAVRLGRGACFVDEILTPVDCVGPEDRVDSVISLLLRRGSVGRVVAVTSRPDNKILGVVARSDVVAFLAQNPGLVPQAPAPEFETHVSLEASKLPKSAVQFLRAAGDLADAMQVGLYVVGGLPRDVLLGLPNDDIDLVVSGGEAIAFARQLHEKLGDPAVPLVEHEAFHTAVVTLVDGSKIDVATARLEYYPLVAALPVVELSSLKMDLSRRDFTINAVAIQLNHQHFGCVVDFFHSRRHITDRVISVLHPLSFIEDPTRLFRAVRFACRYNFSMDPATLRLYRACVEENLVSHLSGTRVFHELEKLMNEANPAACFASLHQLGTLRCLHPDLHVHFVEASITSACSMVRWMAELNAQFLGWKTVLLSMCWSLPPVSMQQFIQRLAPPHTRAGELEQGLKDAHEISRKLSQQPAMAASVLVKMLRPISLEVVLCVMARLKQSGLDWSLLAQYVTHWKHVAPALKGDDLIAIGVKPGPKFGKLLQQLLDDILDGRVSAADRESQIDWVRSHM